jgi:hypothetical protein
MGTSRHAQPTPFGEALRHYREAAGLTQEELAERARTSARAVTDRVRCVQGVDHPGMLASVL